MTKPITAEQVAEIEALLKHAHLFECGRCGAKCGHEVEIQTLLAYINQLEAVIEDLVCAEDCDSWELISPGSYKRCNCYKSKVLKGKGDE